MFLCFITSFPLRGNRNIACKNHWCDFAMKTRLNCSISPPRLYSLRNRNDEIWRENLLRMLENINRRGNIIKSRLYFSKVTRFAYGLLLVSCVWLIERCWRDYSKCVTPTKEKIHFRLPVWKKLMFKERKQEEIAAEIFGKARRNSVILFGKHRLAGNALMQCCCSII